MLGGGRSRGKTTDFQGAVQATDDETVGFSWIEWPDKTSRDSVMRRMDELGKTDERFDPAKNPMPFDGKRMIYGGFEPIVERGEHSSDSYVTAPRSSCRWVDAIPLQSSDRLTLLNKE